jgi:hypothetical protein
MMSLRVSLFVCQSSELPHIAEPFKDDWIRGDALASLLTVPAAEGGGGNGEEGGQLDRLAKVLHAAATDPRTDALLLEWAMQHNHCNTLAASLRMMPSTQGTSPSSPDLRLRHDS